MTNILIGSVQSSRVILEELIQNDCTPIMVFSLDEQVSESVSGYFPLHEIAQKHNIPYRKFKKINEYQNIEEIIRLSPDYIFVVGLSQLVDARIISAAKKGVIGLHPALLPKFRGRAAMVWQILLDVRKSAISLFLIDEGVDSGPIIGQEPFFIGVDDYASDAERNCLDALRRLCKRVIPQMKNDCLKPLLQDNSKATYLLKRTPEDGMIDWSLSIYDIHRLIRAVSHPYPGAFSHYDGKIRLTIWRAEIEKNTKYIGIPGQIAEKAENTLGIVCKDGLLRVTEYTCETPIQILVGHKLRAKGDIL